MIQANHLEIPQTLAEACAPSRTALIVYDMQVGILRQLKDGAAITAKVVQVLRAAREAGVRIFFTRHMSLPKELLGAFQLRMAMAWQRVASPEEVRPWFLRDSPGFQLIPEIAPLPSEAVFDKLAIVGVRGDAAQHGPPRLRVEHVHHRRSGDRDRIEPTVRHGADLGYIPIVVTDACGQVTRTPVSGRFRRSAS